MGRQGFTVRHYLWDVKVSQTERQTAIFYSHAFSLSRRRAKRVPGTPSWQRQCRHRRSPSAVMNYGSEAERSSMGSAGVAPVAWKPRCQPRGSPAKTSRQAVDKIYRYPLAIACVRLGAVTQPSNLFQRKINGLSMTESSKWAWCWQSRVCSLTMPYHLSVAPKLGGGGGGEGGSHRSDNALSVYQYHTAWRGGGGGSHRSDNALSVYQQHTAWGEGGVVTGLTMPCQSINTTQAGGGGGGGSHRSDNALSVCQQHTAWGKGGG